MTLDWDQIRSPIWHWLVGMTLLTAYFILADLACSSGGCGDATLANLCLIGLAALMLICGRSVVVLMQVDTRLLFTPLVSYAASSALFFGFGPMSTFLASEATLRFQANSIYALNGQDVLSTSLLSSMGITISLIGILSVLPRHTIQARPQRALSVKSVALIFLVTGLALKHLVIMPSIYGQSSYFVPGMLRNLRYLPDLGFALTAMIAASGNRRWALLFWLLWPWHFLLAFPEFSKKSVMLTMLLPALGAYVGHRSLARFSVWLVAAVAVFVTLQNANAVARWAENEADSYHEVLSVPQRLEILTNTTFSDVDIEAYLPVAKLGVETWWLRLNYSGPQSAAIDLYDSGVSSTFTQNPLIYVIPRILWPEKPVIISPGREFHATVTGNNATRTKVGITVFADGYWKMGWFGVIVFAGFMGAVYGMFTRFSMNQLARRQFLYLPAAMLGLQMGATASTAFLQNSVISALPVYFAFCLVVFLIYQVLGRMASQLRQPPSFSDPLRPGPMIPAVGE